MTSDSTKELKILIAGLIVHANIPAYFRELYGTPEQIQAAVTANEHRIREAGFNVTSYQINDADAATGLKWIESELRSEHFDGIIIGSGLRLVPTQTALFESVMDVCRRVRPEAVFMFNSGPGTNWDTLQRNMEKLQSVK